MEQFGQSSAFSLFCTDEFKVECFELIEANFRDGSAFGHLFFKLSVKHVNFVPCLVQLGDVNDHRTDVFFPRPVLSGIAAFYLNKKFRLVRFGNRQFAGMAFCVAQNTPEVREKCILKHRIDKPAKGPAQQSAARNTKHFDHMQIDGGNHPVIVHTHIADGGELIQLEILVVAFFEAGLGLAEFFVLKVQFDLMNLEFMGQFNKFLRVCLLTRHRLAGYFFGFLSQPFMFFFLHNLSLHANTICILSLGGLLQFSEQYTRSRLFR